MVAAKFLRGASPFRLFGHLYLPILQDYWIAYPKGGRYTLLLAAIHARTLNSFTRGLLSILTIPVDQSLYLLRAQHVARILQKRVIPEIEAIGDKVALECQTNVVKIAIELICMDKAREPTRWGIALVVQWYTTSPLWKPSIEKALREMVSTTIFAGFAETDYLPPPR